MKKIIFACMFACVFVHNGSYGMKASAPGESLKNGNQGQSREIKQFPLEESTKALLFGLESFLNPYAEQRMIYAEESGVKKVQSFSNGEVVKKFKDGTIVKKFPNGTIVTEFKNMTPIITFPDGSIIETRLDKTTMKALSDGIKAEKLMSFLIRGKKSNIFSCSLSKVVSALKTGAKVAAIILPLVLLARYNKDALVSTGLSTWHNVISGSFGKWISERIFASSN